MIIHKTYSGYPKRIKYFYFLGKAELCHFKNRDEIISNKVWKN